MRGSARTHTHTGRGAGQTDGSDRLMNRKSANDKKKERKHWPCDMCACVCICQPRDLLSEQLAAHAAPQLGPGVAVPLQHGGLRLAGQIVLVLVHAAVLLQTLAH